MCYRALTPGVSAVLLRASAAITCVTPTPYIAQLQRSRRHTRWLSHSSLPYSHALFPSSPSNVWGGPSAGASRPPPRARHPEHALTTRMRHCPGVVKHMAGTQDYRCSSDRRLSYCVRVPAHPLAGVETVVAPPLPSPYCMSPSTPQTASLFSPSPSMCCARAAQAADRASSSQRSRAFLSWMSMGIARVA